jgi:hypothetical protein
MLGLGLDVEGVLSDLSGDAWDFCWSPHKNVLVAPEEVDELAFLFGAQASPDLNGLGRVSASISMALVSSTSLKVPDVEGMDGLAKESGALRQNSFSSAAMAVMVAAASSMLFYSQSNARWALASTMMTSAGPDILILR